MTLSTLQQAEWQSIMDMTQRMGELSMQQEWQGVTSLAIERQARLEKFFARLDKSSPEAATTVAQGIEHILASDRQLVSTGLALQTELGDDLHKITTSRKAVRLYQDTSR